MGIQMKRKELTKTFMMISNFQRCKGYFVILIYLGITVDLVIFACLNFREFLILGLFPKFRIREFSSFLNSAFIIIIFGRYLNSQICPPREIREN